MNIYKNLMFLHGYLVDPRDADEDGDTAQGTGRTVSSAAPAAAAKPVTRKVVASRAAAATASHRAQAERTGAITGWRAWLRLWPAQSARIEPSTDCGAHGCT